MNDAELLDRYHSLQEDFESVTQQLRGSQALNDEKCKWFLIRAETAENKLQQIEILLTMLGMHPAFTLPPVSLFIAKLKEILNG